MIYKNICYVLFSLPEIFWLLGFSIEFDSVRWVVSFYRAMQSSVFLQHRLLQKWYFLYVLSRRVDKIKQLKTLQQMVNDEEFTVQKTV